MPIRDEAVLAALCQQPAALPDVTLAELALARRPFAAWVGWRLAYDGGASRHPALAGVARTLAARDAIATARLRAVITALADAGVPSLVLKGAALAAWYPASWMRPRLDDDLLVPRASFGAACRVLEAAGYDARPQNPGPEDLGQAHFSRQFAAGDRHHVDLHWRALAPVAFHDLPSFDALRARAMPLPALGAAAVAPAPVDALMHAVAHRVAHHGEDTDPQWLLDVHLVASSLSSSDWERLSAAAREARCARILAHELARAHNALGTPVPAWLLAHWQSVHDEPSAAHLRARGRLRRWWLDASQQPGGAWSVIRARAFPPADYMVRRYGVPRALVSLAYGWRLGIGGAAWMIEAIRPRWR